MKHKHFEFHGGHITWTGKEPPSQEVIESLEKLWRFVQDIDIRTAGSRGLGPNPIDDFFRILNTDEEIRTMPKDEYIDKARDFIAKVNSMYWSNWSWRTLTDDELPEESQCDNCVEGCVVKLNDIEYDCVSDRRDGVCRIRIFDVGNYAAEMEELMNEFDDIELLDTEIQLT